MNQEKKETNLNKNGDRRGMSPNSQKNLKPNGRPKRELDYELIERLANIHCTQEEIASVLGVSVDTLQRDFQFCGIYKKGIENSRISLRRLQWRTAEGIEPEVIKDSLGQPYVDIKGRVWFSPGIPPNAGMQIWLGKQYLEQREPKQQHEHSGDEENPILIKLLEELRGNGS